MASLIDTTILPACETPPCRAALAVCGFATSLPALIADERDLAGYSGQDPTVDAWFRAAERSRGATHTCLNAVISAQPMCRPDRAMHLVAVVFRAVLVSSNADQVGRLTMLVWRMFAPSDLPRDVGRTIDAVLNALNTLCRDRELRRCG